MAEAPDGSWTGTVVVLVERAGTRDFLGEKIPEDQAQLVGVFVRDGARGSGVAEALFRAAVEWSWGLEEPRVSRVRLYVHAENERARGFYRKFGFAQTGAVASLPGDVPGLEVEMAVGR